MLARFLFDRLTIAKVVNSKIQFAYLEQAFDVFYSAFHPPDEHICIAFIVRDEDLKLNNMIQRYMP